ncbi:hypothetical protein KR018_008551 [Drosophila ironensis]|nr:hypothetical protein KR018_008551 [Drosophila ironensis]
MEAISQFGIISTGISTVWRFASIIINWILAYEYWINDAYAYSAWTIASILVPMVVTSIIYIHILQSSNTVQNRIPDRGVSSNVVLSYLFRDGYALNYARKFNRAKEQGDRDMEIRYYQKLTTEECNVGFVRLFDSFLESVPQKILQLVIVLRSKEELSYYRLAMFAVYFGSLAWCIQAYNRSNRLVQLDKHDIAAKGRFVQFFFLICLTGNKLYCHLPFVVSRTLCIAYMASLFPHETLALCLVHICLSALIVFLVDAKMIAKSRPMNCLYCLCFGIVYLFIFTPVKDAPTKYKYSIYLTICLLQNIVACALFIPLYFSIAIIVLYVTGIVLIILYYLTCHPSIIAL